MLTTTPANMPSQTSPALGMIDDQLQDSVVVATASDLDLCSSTREGE